MGRLTAIARQLKIEAHAAWLCARDPDVPIHARMFGLLIAAYALSPIDLIPDFIPVLGLLDEAILIPLGIWLFLKMVPTKIYARHRTSAEAASHRPVSRSGAAVILFIWLAVLSWGAALLWSSRLS